MDGVRALSPFLMILQGVRKSSFINPVIASDDFREFEAQVRKSRKIFSRANKTYVFTELTKLFIISYEY